VFEPSKKTNCVITLHTTMGIFCEQDLVEREQEQAINETPAFVEKNLIKREDKDTINETVSYSSPTYNGLNSFC
jgi:hypothetical protein